jgi:AcrR family transcriptional regulator
MSGERISETALQLIDKHGMDALSMRRLGKELKVEAMALYYHFKNKGELLDAVLERLVDEVLLAPRDSMTPLDWLRDFARSSTGKLH